MLDSPIVDTSFAGSIKTIWGLFSGFLLMVGSSIEPSIGIWVISVSGALLTSTFGKDRPYHVIIMHLFIGLGWGIFGSQIIHSEFTAIPQLAACFFSSMFGVEATWFVIRNLKESTFSDIIANVVNSVINKFVKKRD